MSVAILPPEIIEIILSYVGEKRRIRLVCRQFFAMIPYTHFSVGLVLNSEVNAFIKCFSRYNKPIGLTLNKDEDNSFLVRSSVTKITALTQLTYLDITCKDKGIAYGRLTNLVSLKTKSITQHDLQQLTNLTELEIWRKIEIIDSTRRALPTSLVSLRFAGFDTPSYRAKVSDAQWSTFLEPLPRLTKLIVYRGGEYILNVTPNLRKLTLRKNAKFPSDLFLPSLYELESPSHATFVPHHQQVTLTKLETYDMFPEGAWNVECLTNLRAVTMDYGWTNNARLWSNLQSMNLGCIDASNFLTSLPHPARLTKLSLGMFRESTLPILQYTNLIDLTFSHRSSADIQTDFVSSFVNLTRLHTSGATRHTYLSALTKLKDLRIAGSGYRFQEAPCELDLQALTNLTSLMLSVPVTTLFSNIKLNGPLLENLTVLYYPYFDSDITDPMDIRGCHTLTRLTRLEGHLAHQCLDFTDLVQLTTLKYLKACMQENEDLSLLTRLCYLTSLEITSRVDRVEDLLGLTRLQRLSIKASHNIYRNREHHKDMLLQRLPLLSKVHLE